MQESERIHWLPLALFVAFYIWVIWEFIPPAPQPLFEISRTDAQLYWGRR